MKKLLSIIMLLSLAGSLYTMEDQREKEEEEKEQSENSTIMTEVTWGFLKGLPSDVALSIVSYLTLKERLHVLAGLLFEIKRDKKEHLLSEREELIKSLLRADDKESWEMGHEILNIAKGAIQDAEQRFNKIMDLIQNGANVNIQDKQGSAPLHVMARSLSGNLYRNFEINIINALLNSGADVNLVSKWEETPLACATLRSYSVPNYELIQILIQNNADPRIRPKSGFFFSRKTAREIAEDLLKNRQLQPEVEEDLLKTIKCLKAAEEAWEQKTANKEEQ